MQPLVITGANGFIGKNLVQRAKEMGFSVRTLGHIASAEQMRDVLNGAGMVFHLAGVNRPQNEREFETGNVGMTAALCRVLAELGAKTSVVYASSIQAERDNPYGRSKRAAEAEIEKYRDETGAAVFVYRLPNVFGKWCRPNYNSVVANFCHNIARGLPISINDPCAKLSLVYVDDVVDTFLLLAQGRLLKGDCSVDPVYETTVGDLAELIAGFGKSRETLVTGAVGQGLKRALHSTYLSYLEPEHFDYPLTSHRDARGVFVEMLRTPDCGQFSYFTAHPGVTRGGHYHHSKSEKFLVLQGSARFGFRHILTDQTFEIFTSGEEPRVVETVPGWAHDVTNVGEETLVVMLWANEIFDKDRPDTIAAKVSE